MLTITENILFSIKNSSKMLINVNTLVKKKQTKLLNIANIGLKNRRFKENRTV